MRSKRDRHIESLNERFRERNQKTLNKYCKNKMIDDIEKLSGDEIKETIIEHIKSEHYDRIKSVKMLSEHYRHFFQYRGKEFKICNDIGGYYDRLSVDYTNSGVTMFRLQYDLLNEKKIRNNESSLFKKEYDINDEESELVDILQSMSNSQYNSLYKKLHSIKNIEDELL